MLFSILQVCLSFLRDRKCGYIMDTCIKKERLDTVWWPAFLGRKEVQFMMDKSAAQLIYQSGRLEDTQKLAAALAKLTRSGSVLVLDGDLGAGKTAFSQAFARALGVEGYVNSPTFTIIKEYQGRIPLYHMDVYRLSQDEADELGLDEYFFGDGVTLVEWGTLIDELLPQNRLHIYIEVSGETERVIYLYGQGEPYSLWTEKLKENGV